MNALINRQVKLLSRPMGIPQAENFEIVEEAVLELGMDQVLIRNVFLSVEPAMRGWVSAIGNYSEPVPLGSVMRSFAAGRVEESRDPDFPVGTWVTGMFGWQDYARVDASGIQRKVTDRDLPLSSALGVLGINGVTAHYGLLQIGRPQKGEVVVVSTAAGSVGSCVGQIAKIKGCHTVGITGGAEKRNLCIGEFGFDAVIDYKKPEFESLLADACRGGVDIYYDNTGGHISDAVMQHLNVGARVIICGTASVASWDPIPAGPRVERHLLVKRASMQGFVIFDHPDYYESAYGDLSQWIREGTLRYLEDIKVGIEHAPDAIAGLYRGENLGKRIIRIADDSSS
jgi:NADPH-dependent curcumin reductase CurA